VEGERERERLYRRGLAMSRAPRGAIDAQTYSENHIYKSSSHEIAAGKQ